MRRWVRKPSYFASFFPDGRRSEFNLGGSKSRTLNHSPPGRRQSLGSNGRLVPLLPPFLRLFAWGGKDVRARRRQKKGKRDYPQSTLTLLDRLREQIGKIPFSFVSSWRREGKKKMAESPDQALQKNGSQHRFFIFGRRTATRLYFSFFFLQKGIFGLSWAQDSFPHSVLGLLKSQYSKDSPSFFFGNTFFCKKPLV